MGAFRKAEVEAVVGKVEAVAEGAVAEAAAVIAGVAVGVVDIV